MEELLDKYDVDKKHSLEEIATLHAEYDTSIQDGNGRIDRIIIFRECLKSEIISLIIADENKGDYYVALMDNQNNKKAEKSFNFFKQEQHNYFELAKDFVIPCLNKNETKIELYRKIAKVNHKGIKE